MAKVTKDFSFSGAVQNWSVPSGITSILWRLWGAPGGLAGHPVAKNKTSVSGQSGAGNFPPDSRAASVKQLGDCARGDETGSVGLPNGVNPRSLPGYVEGVFDTTPGAVWHVYVGGGGGHGGWGLSKAHGGPGGYNGGGDGGGLASGTDVAQGGGGGGGATDVRQGGTALANRKAVAGGGGGSAYGVTIGPNPNSVSAQPKSPFPYGMYEDGATGVSNDFIPTPGGVGGGYGGPGGSRVGGSAQNGGRGATHDSGDGTLVAGSAGQGGGSAAGGPGGTAGSGGFAGSPGSLGDGGDGADIDATAINPGGGGGGGGLYGGGGGAGGYTGSFGGSGYSGSAGGGGGSNYIDPDATSKVSLAGIYPVNQPLVSPHKKVGVPNGHAQVQYQQPPDPPIFTNPVDGLTIDSNQSLEIDWEFSSQVASARQAAVDLDYSDDGGSTWTSIIAGGGGHTTNHTVSTGTFTSGNTYKLRIRAYDQDGDVSAYSTITFKAEALAAAPTINLPVADSDVSTEPFDTDWTPDPSSPDILSRLTLFDSDGNIEQQVDYDDGRTNLCANPTFDTDTSLWTAEVATLGRSASITPQEGSQSMTVAWGGGDTILQAASYVFDTQPGEWYSMVVGVAEHVTNDLEVQIGLGNAGDSQPFVYGDTTDLGGAIDTWQRIELIAQAQSDSSQLMVIPSDTPAGTEVHFINAVLISIGAAADPATLANIAHYFDFANTPDGPGDYPYTGSVSQPWTDSNGGSVAVFLPDTPTTNYDGLGVTDAGPKSLTISASSVASKGLQSPTASVDFTLNLNPPGTPTIESVTEDDDNGLISFKVLLSDDPNPTTSVDVFRTDVTNGTPEIRIAEGISLTEDGDGYIEFTDYTPASNVLYEYKFRAYSSLGGFADATSE